MNPTFFRLFLLLSVGGSVVAHAQAPLTATQAYEYLQSERARASQVVSNTDKPPVDSLRKAEQILRDALTYYAQPDVQELASGNIGLKARKFDILRDLALIQARAGKDSTAIVSLRESMDARPERAWVFDVVDERNEYARLRERPDYKQLVQSFKGLDQVFKSKTLATPYVPNLSDAEKVAGLSKLWSEAKYNFAHFDKIPDVDWDNIYLEYIPKVRATTSTVGYYRVLKQFYAQLRDGHTDVWASAGPLADSVNARPPLVSQLVEGRVFLQLVRSDSLLRTGIVPGLEIVQIDGLPVIDYANRYVRPYQSGSTTQNVDVQTYAYNLLRGPKDQPVTVLFRDQTGKTFSRTLPRSGYGTLTPVESVSLRFMPGNVAYFQINEFESTKSAQRFVAAFDSIAAANALIIDLRRNGGGNSDYTILSYLTNQPFGTGRSSSRLYSPTRRARGEGVKYELLGEGRRQPNGKKLYTKPVVVLTSGQTFSAAEDFVVAFDAMKRGTIIGEPTGGSTGQPLSFALPGGVMGRVCTKRDTYPDGTEWVGKGVQPNVLVRPTAADLQAGRDPVLDAALRHLNPAGSGSAGSSGRKTRPKTTK